MALIDDLRMRLQDGPTNKLAVHKPALQGDIDGSNKVFILLEPRYVAASLKAYLNSSPVTVTALDTLSGLVELATAPTSGKLTFSYFWQYFIDSELEVYLRQGAGNVGLTDYTLADASLQPVIVEYAASYAYMFLATEWVRNMAEKIQLSDAPQQTGIPVPNHFLQLKKDAWNSAEAMKKEYYTGQGRRNVPFFNAGNIPGSNWTPRR